MDSSLGFLITVLTLLLLSPFPSLVESSPSSKAADQAALLSFKALVTSDPSGTLSSWNDSSTACQWSGVFCDGQSQRVSGLDLHGLRLKGSISPALGNLSSLRFLYLQDNNLAGALPDRLGDLSRLQFLNASSNLIQGVIPLNITKCSELRVLDLSGNIISGRLPPELQMLSKLQILKLSQNQLTGVIPQSIGNLSALTTLDLGTNTLHGPIPDDLGRLHNLQKLQISINNLTGRIPPSIYNVSSLVTFALASNNLWGELPSDVGFRLPKLTLFHVCYNGFTGPIPPSLNNITKIQSLRMSHNFLTGAVPPGLGNLPDLIMYNIGFNLIVSEGLDFLASLTNSTKLEFLAIDGNFMEGVIPESVGNLSTRLSKFYIGGNRIYGTIPASIGRLTSLTLFNMSQNSLSGEIPPSIGRLNELRMLGLAGNQLSGQIPGDLGNLSQLTKLELYGNHIYGRIPSTFINFQQLESLDMSNNKLNGSIPSEIFTLTSLSSILNLSRNSFTGFLPEEVGRLQNLVAIDVSNNLLSGNITRSIGNCKSLQYLSMSHNALSGQIPDILGNLKGLQSLDLSSNQLSGPIPDDLAKLQALQFLNLSFNNLEGEIPKQGIFQNPSRVDLEGNPMLCRSPWCEQGHRRMSTAILITIIVVSVSCTLGIIIGMGIFLIRRRESRAKVTTTIADSIKGEHRMVSYDELLRATGSFNPVNLIGTGSFGSVYRGILRDGVEAAIKVLNLAVRGASKSFIAECEALRNVRHRNLVKLVTLCSSWDFANGDFCALVYELMSNGNLEDWIRGRRRHGDGNGLSVVERLGIAIDVANAMDYLHNDCQGPVVHCDLKPSNVMLDDEMTAKVGDFGLAKLLVDKSSGQDSISSTHGLKGSIGYIPPEYGFGGKPSTRGDVYSYGVMVLELLTAKSPTDESFTADLNLEKWVRAAFPNGTMDVLDAKLFQGNNNNYQGELISTENLQECLASMTGVGLSCAAESPEARITMRDALRQLIAIKTALMKPHVDRKL